MLSLYSHSRNRTRAASPRRYTTPAKNFPSISVIRITCRPGIVQTIITVRRNSSIPAHHPQSMAQYENATPLTSRKHACCSPSEGSCVKSIQFCPAKRYQTFSVCFLSMPIYAFPHLSNTPKHQARMLPEEYLLYFFFQSAGHKPPHCISGSQRSVQHGIHGGGNGHLHPQ